MDNKNISIAVASSDGIVVNKHFGRASKLYIYIISGEELKLLEMREVTPVCNGGNHDDIQLEENMKIIADCDYLLVARIGNGAVQAAAKYNIDAYEIPGIIEESIDQLIRYIKIKELFK